MPTEYALQEIDIDRRHKEGFRRSWVQKLYDDRGPLTDFREAIDRVNELNEKYADVGRQWILVSRTVSEWQDVSPAKALDSRP